MIQFRFHKKAGPSKDMLLIAGSNEDIVSLHSFFVSWTGETSDLVAEMQKQGKVHLDGVTALQVRRDGKRESFTWLVDSGVWSITQTRQADLIDLLDGLLEAHNGGHQYLTDMNNGTVQIICSMGEYPLPEQ